MPCYNERASIREIVRRVLAQPCVLEIVAVDDCSKDGTREELAAMQRELAPRVRVILHEKNRGKGAALRTGFAHVRGPITIVQDADLEYDPADYPALVAPIVAGRADAVYGSRYIGRGADAIWHVLGNRCITWLSNLATRQHLTDMETCYKVFRTPILRRLPLRQDRFGFDPEITALVARLGIHILEVPVGYKARSYEEGKKIRLKDGIRVLSVIIGRGMLGL